MIGKGRQTIDISNIREADIAGYYLGVTSIPCLFNSPLREDEKPSFALFSPEGKRVNFIDFATREHGSIITLMSKLWHLDIYETKKKIYNDLGKNMFGAINISKKLSKKVTINNKSNIQLKCKTRDWEKHDIEYWESYGISTKWLDYADVYPISHKIIIKDGIPLIFGADKYAYAYVEFKENKTTIKIYQPFNKNGFKWCNRHDKSVISLWTKIPKTGNIVCICSSMKDALCLWANTGIPALAIQGEGYGISETAINNLKSRYKEIYICLDNDDVGLLDAEKLASKTGFINIVLPKFQGGKDISDLYKCLNNKEQFKSLIISLFKNGKKRNVQEC